MISIKARTLFILMIVAITLSCGRNRLKMDEKALIKQISAEEETLAQQEAIRTKQEMNSTNSSLKLPEGIKFKEWRKADPQKPPVEIDIAESLTNITNKKLSDVASNITYIRFDPVPEQTFPRNLKFKYFLMDNYIVAANIYGIFLYSKDGKFIRTIVRNQTKGIEYDEKRNQILIWNDYSLIGGWNSIWGIGNNLYYNYKNNITGENYIMMFDCSKAQSTTNPISNSEKEKQITGLGQILIDLNHGQTKPPAPREHLGMSTVTPESIYQDIDVFAPDSTTYINKMWGKNMWGIFGRQGDTLTTFSKLEKSVDYTKSRETDRGIQYEMQGNLFFRSNFNDTIFQVIPPNRINPVYVLKLGRYKVSKKEGIDPDFNLSGKIIPQDWAETKSYLFLTFTMDSYDCPYNRKNKSVKIYHAIFSKANLQLQVIKSDPTDYSAPILENNIDGGCPVWPQSYMIGNKGEIASSLKGHELKSKVLSNQFQKSTASAEKKEKLKRLSDSITDQDDILMIVE